jgi:hypothetical protein
MSKLEMLTPQNSGHCHDRLSTGDVLERSAARSTGNVRQHSVFLAKAAKDLMSFAMNGAEDRNGTLT